MTARMPTRLEAIEKKIRRLERMEHRLMRIEFYVVPPGFLSHLADDEWRSSTGSIHGFVYPPTGHPDHPASRSAEPPAGEVPAGEVPRKYRVQIVDSCNFVQTKVVWAGNELSAAMRAGALVAFDGEPGKLPFFVKSIEEDEK